MNTAKHESIRHNATLIRLRQRQLGRGLRLLYEQVLREPVPPDMIDALDTAAGEPKTVHSKVC